MRITMNSDNKQPNENKIARNNPSKMKKKIVIVIISIIAIMALMFISIFVLDSILDKMQEKEEVNNFNFYEADYDENIFEDTKYLSLIENGYISYCDMDNVTLGIDEENAQTYGKDVAFIVSYIKHMINGEVQEYNHCYSDLYYEKEDPKDRTADNRLLLSVR